MKIKTLNGLNKIKEHIKNKVFSLKDYQYTYNKFKNYKKLKVDNFFKEHEKEMIYFIENDLIDNIIHSININGYLNTFCEFNKLNKFHINLFKTSINNLTYEENKKFLKDLGDLKNENELRTFTILFYLKYYDKINEVMKEVLNDFYFNNFDILNITEKKELQAHLTLRELEK